MAYDDILKLTRVSPHVGAEVADIDITRPLSERQVSALQRALAEFGVLFFHEQNFDHDSQKRFGRYFGELDIHPNTPGPPGHPEILPIHGDANSKVVAGEGWHSDVSCTANPPLGSILHMHVLPESGGDTLFASAGAVYDSLSPRMQTYLEGLTAFHSGDRYYRWRNAKEGIDDSGRRYPSAHHPVVLRHPVSGRKSIYVNSFFTYAINELPKEESEAILNFLYSRFADPMFQTRFRWRKNSVAFWDNRAVQHLAIWDYFPHTRTGSRVTVKAAL